MDEDKPEENPEDLEEEEYKTLDEPLLPPHECVIDGDLEKLKALLESKEYDKESPDENGMSLLGQAAYRGATEIVEYLIQQGADVNSDKHRDGYTPLFFAAIIGHLDVIYLLLENGARHKDVNKLKLTPSQLAGFVGNHRVVTFINNYFPSDVLEPFTCPSGPSEIIRLPSSLKIKLHRLLMAINFSPLRMMENLAREFQDSTDQSNTLIVWSETIAKKVIHQLVDKFFERNSMVETLALKLHFVEHIFLQVAEFYKENLEKTLPECKDCDHFWPLTGLAKTFMKLPNRYGVSIYQERFLRTVLGKYPKCESTLWAELVRTIAVIDPETATESTMHTIMIYCNFKNMLINICKYCATCGESGDDGASFRFVPRLSQCKECKKVYYCNVDCQKVHWFVHKKLCDAWKEEKKNNPIPESDTDPEKKDGASSGSDVSLLD